ncbi:hypothetical protein ACWDR0_05415, partial [Streptomyces sp. NPDC003691]
MTKKTRIRVARIAAGAVIAAGASLTVAGAAQAFTGSQTSDAGLGVLSDDPPADTNGGSNGGGVDPGDKGGQAANGGNGGEAANGG